MANYAEEPLTKVTFNLFTKDVEELKRRYPGRWTTELRWTVRRFLNSTNVIEGKLLLKEPDDAQ